MPQAAGSFRLHVGRAIDGSCPRLPATGVSRGRHPPKPGFGGVAQVEKGHGGQICSARNVPPQVAGVGELFLRREHKRPVWVGVPMPCRRTLALGPPGLRSFETACAPPSMAPLASHAGSQGTGTPPGISRGEVILNVRKNISISQRRPRQFRHPLDRLDDGAVHGCDRLTHGRESPSRPAADRVPEFRGRDRSERIFRRDFRPCTS